MSAGGETVLRLEQVAVEFGGNKVLRGLDLTADLGFTGLIGPNGAGKTTVFNAVSGYVRPSAGELSLDGVSLRGRSSTAIARLGVGRTFQTPRLVGDMTLLDNVLLGVDGRPGHRGRTARARADDLLGAFSLGDQRRTKAADLPLATQKVVEVVRALIGQPRLVLLDEPAAGLSAEDVEALVPPLLEVGASGELAIVIIEHDVELVSRLCPTVAVLHFGVALAVGTPAEVMAHPDVVDAYLGAGFAAVDP